MKENYLADPTKTLYDHSVVQNATGIAMNQLRSLFCSVILAFLLQPATAAISQEITNGLSAQELANSTSIVWLKSSSRTPDELALGASLLAGTLEKNGVTTEPSFVFDHLVGFLVERNVSDSRNMVQGIVKDFSSMTGDEKNVFNDPSKPVEITVEANSVLHSFASCLDPKLRYDAGEILDEGVKRVWKYATPTAYTGPSVAWIIDSGLGTGFAGELNIVDKLDCTQSGCPSDGQKSDSVGHGTMIAGIIGAMTGNSKGVVGVAPGVPINSLRVIDDSTGELNFSSVANALAWLNGNATTFIDGKNTTPSAGDIINISLGGPWSFSDANQEAIETALLSLASKGLKISIAAGNTDVLNELGYVQAIFPARMGAYTHDSGGLIATASAFGRVNNEDWFWQLSAFGNYTSNGKNLPDYAEPGVDIISLWPDASLAQCSGTSLSAAHLSGILLWGPVDRDGYVQYDRSAEKVGLDHKPSPGIPTDYEPTLLDPVGAIP